MSPAPPSPSLLYPLPDTPAGWERLRKSCDACQEAKVKCSQHKPTCHRCVRHGQPCVYSPQRRTGRPRKKATPIEQKPIAMSNMATDTDATATRELPARPAAIRTMSGDSTDLDDSSMVYALHDSRLLRMGIFGDGTDFVDDSVFQPPLGAFMEASFPDIGPSSSGIPTRQFTSLDNNEDYNHHNNINTSFSPSGDFGDFSFMHEYGFPPAPLPSQVLDVDQIPPLSVDASNTNSEYGDCKAKCYKLLLEQLLFLRQEIPESTRPSIDLIFQAETQARIVLDRILGCSMCIGNRSSVLLLSTLTERIIRMLDGIIEEKTLIILENAQSNQRALGSWTQNPASPPSFDSQRNLYHAPLPVGNTKLDDDMRQHFLKQLMLARLGYLATKLQDLRQITTTRPGDCIHHAAELVLAESAQRLDYLHDQVQLWE